MNVHRFLCGANINTNGFSPGMLVLLLIVSQTVSGQDNTTPCFGDLGCFPNNPPWRSVERPVPPPKDPQSVGTRLYCYTRESKERYNITLWPEISLDGCPFDGSKGIVVVTHGFFENGNTSWMNVLKNNYLAEVDVNVFLADWGPGSLDNTYPQAISNTRIVAAEIARFLEYLRENFEITPDQVHLIGFSLGSHIMARVSNIFGKVAQITGLDPARPGFEGLDKSVRLDPSDAKFVDAIHTSAAPLVQDGFGCFKPCGHMDVYVNQGYNQPGCEMPTDIPPITNLNDLATVSQEVLVQLVSCSHVRSTWVYANALLSNCTIWARKLTEFSSKVVENIGPIYLETIRYDENCPPDVCVPIGLKAPLYNATGIFQANTTRTQPFCR